MREFDAQVPWVESQSPSFNARHDSSQSDEANRVLDEWPFPTGWEDWQPDPAWSLPTLPEGWDVV